MNRDHLRVVLFGFLAALSGLQGRRHWLSARPLYSCQWHKSKDTAEPLGSLSTETVYPAAAFEEQPDPPLPTRAVTSHLPDENLRP